MEHSARATAKTRYHQCFSSFISYHFVPQKDPREAVCLGIRHHLAHQQNVKTNLLFLLSLFLFQPIFDFVTITQDLKIKNYAYLYIS